MMIPPWPIRSASWWMVSSVGAPEGTITHATFGDSVSLLTMSLRLSAPVAPNRRDAGDRFRIAIKGHHLMAAPD